MKVQNMTNSKGNSIANQFIIHDDEGVSYFQSYNSIIARVDHSELSSPTTLDINKWDYSVTTGRYRNQFLGESKKETQAKIDSGEYVLTDLN